MTIIDPYFKTISKTLLFASYGPRSSIECDTILAALQAIKKITDTDAHKALIRARHISILHEIPAFFFCSNEQLFEQITENAFNLGQCPVRISKKENTILYIKNYLIKKYPTKTLAFSESFFKYGEKEARNGHSLFDSQALVQLSLVNRSMQARCKRIWAFIMNPTFFQVSQLERIFPQSSVSFLERALNMHAESLVKMIASILFYKGNAERCKVCNILVNFIDDDFIIPLLKFYLIQLSKSEYCQDFTQSLVINERPLNTEKLLDILNETGAYFGRFRFKITREYRPEISFWIRCIRFYGEPSPNAPNGISCAYQQPYRWKPGTIYQYKRTEPQFCIT